jgi:hypothetical protein
VFENRLGLPICPQIVMFKLMTAGNGIYNCKSGVAFRGMILIPHPSTGWLGEGADTAYLSVLNDENRQRNADFYSPFAVTLNFVVS